MQMPVASPRWQIAGSQAIVIALLVVTVHHRAVDGGFVRDDNSAIVENRLIHSPHGLRDFWCSTTQPDYWPVSYSVLWLEWRVFGPTPTGYRAVNIGLHAVNALLVWRLLMMLDVPSPWLCALLFAVHPVTVEAVAWIIQIKTLLSMLFALATLMLFLRWQATGPWRYLVAALAAFVLALLSKSTVVTLPVALLVIVWWRQGRLTRRDLLALLTLLAISLVLGGIGTWFQSHNAISGDIVRTDSFWSRLAIAARAVWF
ncbi:MAG: glycosyltransferase family 39 protein [Pirellulales bacterium]|nr:glycosyltransferase family 39 protein [Pirellulales bacterium]